MFEQPASQEMMVVVNAVPRRQPKPLPTFANPSRRPHGSEPALILEFVSQVPTLIDIAMRRVPRRDAAACVRSIQEVGDRDIVLTIDDAGGLSDDAVAVASALLAHPRSVEAQIVGRCSSSAVLLALAADIRTIAPGGRVLIHESLRVYTEQQFAAVQRFSAADRNAINESLCDSDDVTVSLLICRLGVTEQTARAWMAEGRSWNASESLANGFVDAIVDTECAA
ncbi:ATP-dependent Clp protease proteolytic subunit [Bradyrhizobium sp. USDA 4529]